MLCGEGCLSKGDQQTKLAVTLRCRSWCCADCQPRRSKQLVAEVLRGAPDTFLTLTSRRRPGLTPTEAAHELSNAWNILRKRIHREAVRDISRAKNPYGVEPAGGYKRDSEGRVARQVNVDKGKLEHFTVFEATQFGWPHLHVLCRSKWMNQAWLSAQMNDLIGSPVVSVERVANKRSTAAYVAKYTGKAPHKFGTCKRYWQSKNWKIVARPENKSVDGVPGKWERQSMSLAKFAAMWTEWQWTIEWLAPDRLTARAPP